MKIPALEERTIKYWYILKLVLAVVGIFFTIVWSANSIWLIATAGGYADRFDGNLILNSLPFFEEPWRSLVNQELRTAMELSKLYGIDYIFILIAFDVCLVGGIFASSIFFFRYHRENQS